MEDGVCTVLARKTSCSSAHEYESAHPSLGAVMRQARRVYKPSSRPLEIAGSICKHDAPLHCSGRLGRCPVVLVQCLR